jgi:hypothetical protein
MWTRSASTLKSVTREAAWMHVDLSNAALMHDALPLTTWQCASACTGMKAIQRQHVTHVSETPFIVP